MFEFVLARQAQGFMPAWVPLRRALLERYCLLPPPTGVPFDEALRRHLAEGPWAESHKVAPGETARAVERALRDLMLASGTLRVDSIDLAGLDSASRAWRHLDALRVLWVRLGDALPDDLAYLRAILEARPEEIIEPLHVVYDPSAPGLTAAERAVLETLERRHGTAPDSVAQRAQLITARDSCRGRPGSALAHLQAGLLSPRVKARALDESLRVFGLRDAAAESDFAASLVQSWLDADATLSPAEVGLLIPAGPHYVPFLRDAFARAGLPVSGLPCAGEWRDVAGETLLHFLICQRQPAPAMAFASLLQSPLMPWTAAEGRKWSQAVMDGRGLREMSGSSRTRVAAMVRLLSDRNVPRAHALAERLQVFASNLGAAEMLADNVEALVEGTGLLRAFLLTLGPDAEVPWEDLSARVPVLPWRETAAGPEWIAGVTLGVDGEALPRAVRHLVVLGFSSGAYPAAPSVSPLFLESEIARIRTTCGLQLSSRADMLAARMRTLRRQLAAACDTLTLLVPYRDLRGGRMPPSASIALMLRCFDGIKRPEDLICDLTNETRLPVGTLPVAPEIKSMGMPPPSVPELLSLNANLLALRTDKQGQALAQTPSRLETLLVSPLAWLLNELDIVERPWEPETLDAMTKGSLFHRVIEGLFLPNAPLPGEAEIIQRLPDLLASEIADIAPFLAGGAWMVERQSLESEVLKVALAWRTTLIRLGAEIVGSEEPLRGTALGITCRGIADCVLRLADGSLIIIDHKTSGSGVRRRRMENGWDLQVDIYRALISNPGPEGVPAALSTNGTIGVGYHTTRDGALLLHGLPAEMAGGAAEIIGTEIGAAAMARLKAEIDRLRKGELRLPRADEHEVLKKAGVQLYALDTSPLVGFFTPPAPVKEDEDA